MTHPKILVKIDWTDLRSQKTMLLETINNDAVDPEHKEGLEGILALIDALQDYAVDEMGVPEIHVFDFELEEEREQSTPEEIFARESARNIFDELRESDGFHTDDEMPSEFIEGIMADNMHADIIRGKITNQILEDLNEKPLPFVIDGTGKLFYDSSMRDDYEGVATGYIKFLFNDKKVKTLWLCPGCGSDNIEIKVWRHANYFEHDNNDRDDNTEDDTCYCRDCETTGEVVLETIPVNKRVVGFQVVDVHAGDIHPDMDGSFCLYNLSQARAMFNKDVKGDWKILCIWTGDVEQPTLMYTGNPRD